MQFSSLRNPKLRHGINAYICAQTTSPIAHREKNGFPGRMIWLRGEKKTCNEEDIRVQAPVWIFAEHIQIFILTPQFVRLVFFHPKK